MPSSTTTWRELIAAALATGLFACGSASALADGTASGDVALAASAQNDGGPSTSKTDAGEDAGRASGTETSGNSGSGGGGSGGETSESSVSGGGASGGDDMLLAGPRVKESSEKAEEAAEMGMMMAGGAIYELTFEGEIEHPEGSPEEAALEYLGLTDEQQRVIDALLAGRASKLDAWVASKIRELPALQAAFQSLRNASGVGSGIGGGLGGADQETRRLIRRTVQELKPFMEPPLRDSIAVHLTPRQTVIFDELLDDYHAAVMQDFERRAEENGRPFRPQTVERSLEFRRLSRELMLAYERQITEPAREFNDTVDAMAVSPESKSKIRDEIRAFLEEHGRDAPPDEIRTFIRGLLRDLPPEDRAEVIRILREERGGITPGPRDNREGKGGARKGGQGGRNAKSGGDDA